MWYKNGNIFDGKYYVTEYNTYSFNIEICARETIVYCLGKKILGSAKRHE